MWRKLNYLWARVEALVKLSSFPDQSKQWYGLSSISLSIGIIGHLCCCTSALCITSIQSRQANLFPCELFLKQREKSFIGLITDIFRSTTYIKEEFIRLPCAVSCSKRAPRRYRLALNPPMSSRATGRRVRSIRSPLRWLGQAEGCPVVLVHPCPTKYKHIWWTTRRTSWALQQWQSQRDHFQTHYAS